MCLTPFQISCGQPRQPCASSKQGEPVILDSALAKTVEELRVTVKYLMDACVLSETSKVRPDLGIVHWLSEVRKLVIPMGAIVEFEQGIRLRAQHDLESAVRLSEWLDDLLSTGIRLLNTDVAIARKYGEMRACGSLKPLFLTNPDAKMVRGGQDVHIAAAAIAHGYTIATLNVKDFLFIHRWFPIPGLYDPKANHWYIVPGDRRVYELPSKDPSKGARLPG